MEIEVWHDERNKDLRYYRFVSKEKTPLVIVEANLKTDKIKLTDLREMRNEAA